MTDQMLVSVLIPARNEARDIERCIEAVGRQEYSSNLLEVILIDGCSDDGTAEIAKRALGRFPFRSAAVIQNPLGTTPSSLNLGLSMVRGEIVCRVDARSLIPPGYIRTCVDALASRPEVVVVGGSQVAIPPRPGPVGAGIARALNNRYATGLSRYRRSASSGATDTVYLGSFRTDQLREAGGWDERFHTNQDFELNRRLRKQGLLWFDSDLTVEYVPRSSLADLRKQYRRFGRWKAGAWLEGGVRILPRQLALLAAPAVAMPVLASRAVRRDQRVLTGLVGAAGILVLASRPAAIPEHAVEILAVLVIGASWWFGVLEQLARFVCGERLLAGPVTSSAGRS